MIQFEFQVCGLDHCPIETSKAYKKLKKIDPKAAKQSIYIKLVPEDTG